LINCAAQPFGFCKQEDHMKRKTKPAKALSGMTPVHPNAAAIDIGATMHVAAVSADRSTPPVRTFGAFTNDLHRLADWFAECGVETVVMESTSVYWIPIFELLDERGVEVFLVNARDAKHVPGRKTDVNDAQWLQRLHSYGLLRASFRPKGDIAELLPSLDELDSSGLGKRDCAPELVRGKSLRGA
jgi:transposase